MLSFASASYFSCKPAMLVRQRNPEVAKQRDLVDHSHLARTLRSIGYFRLNLRRESRRCGPDALAHCLTRQRSILVESRTVNSWAVD
jgi:hypothetical protein